MRSARPSSQNPSDPSYPNRPEPALRDGPALRREPSDVSAERQDPPPPRARPPEQVVRLAEPLIAELAPLLPSHRFGIATDSGLPRVAVDEVRLSLALLALLLYGAASSPQVRLVASLVRRPRVDHGARCLLEIRLRTDRDALARDGALLVLALRVCEAEGIAWGFDAAGLYTLWPVAVGG
ncbi:MAG: hypothetical protein U1A78_07420 [Polyangia bacterium]